MLSLQVYVHWGCNIASSSCKNDKPVCCYIVIFQLKFIRHKNRLNLAEIMFWVHANDQHTVIRYTAVLAHHLQQDASSQNIYACDSYKRLDFWTATTDVFVIGHQKCTVLADKSKWPQCINNGLLVYTRKTSPIYAASYIIHNPLFITHLKYDPFLR